MAGYEAFDGDPQWLVSGSDYANQAVGLLEQGHQLDSDPSRWLRQQPILMGQMYRTIGLAHANEGRWAEAEQAYMRVLSYDCGDPTAYYLLGQMSDTQYQAVAKAYNDLKQKNDENATLQFAQARDLARKTLNHFAQAYQATIVHRNAPSFTRLKLSSLQKMHQLQPIVFYVEPKVVKDKKGRTKLVPQRQPSFDSYLKTLPGICPKQATE
jgi:tetratricopeptide (TPR) repeat protein